jgi:hypothetical protein
MKSLSDLFQSKRQNELSGFLVYILEDGPADGKAAVRCVAFDAEEHVLRCCFLLGNAETAEYELTVLRDVHGPLRATEYDESGIVGGLKCTIAKYDRNFLKVIGQPDPSIFRLDRQKSIHYGRIQG